MWSILREGNFPREESNASEMSVRRIGYPTRELQTTELQLMQKHVKQKILAAEFYRDINILMNKDAQTHAPNIPTELIVDGSGVLGPHHFIAGENLPQIQNLDRRLPEIDEDVRGFEISVRDPFLVKIPQPEENLAGNGGDLAFTRDVVTCEGSSAAADVLEEKTDRTAAHVERAVAFQDVWMIQALQDFDLAADFCNFERVIAAAEFLHEERAAGAPVDCFVNPVAPFVFRRRAHLLDIGEAEAEIGFHFSTERLENYRCLEKKLHKSTFFNICVCLLGYKW
ncbi:non-structural protein 1 [Striga asiatica]|uniref:Non-structural protein 1 n=1 Tax=Striga asiatica TaxID=4170 RepID=A0A5A7R576_STRAF|nr:non-structural protein 1 [Striga asiatica]